MIINTAVKQGDNKTQINENDNDVKKEKQNWQWQWCFERAGHNSNCLNDSMDQRVWTKETYNTWLNLYSHAFYTFCPTLRGFNVDNSKTM